MKLSTKLLLLGGGLVVCAFLGLQLYCQGKKVGEATTKNVDLKKELNDLDQEKHAIRESVHALDHDALRNRILELSSRVHEEAARSAK